MYFMIKCYYLFLDYNLCRVVGDYQLQKTLLLRKELYGQVVSHSNYHTYNIFRHSAYKQALQHLEECRDACVLHRIAPPLP